MSHVVAGCSRRSSIISRRIQSMGFLSMNSVVDTWSQTVVEATRLSKKRSQLWLQNFSLDEQGEQYLEPSFTKLFNAEPDEVACYYYWRNNVNPSRVWQTTRSLLQHTPRRQLYWQSTPPRIPVVSPGSASDIKRSTS